MASDKSKRLLRNSFLAVLHHFNIKNNSFFFFFFTLKYLLVSVRLQKIPNTHGNYDNFHGKL